MIWSRSATKSWFIAWRLAVSSEVSDAGRAFCLHLDQQVGDRLAGRHGDVDRGHGAIEAVRHRRIAGDVAAHVLGDGEDRRRRPCAERLSCRVLMAFWVVLQLSIGVG